MVDSATVFATQAKAAGVTINVDQRPELLRQPVPQAGLLGRLLGHAQLPPPGASTAACRTSPYNETHWPPKSGTGSNFIASTSRRWPPTDDAKRIEIMHEMQKLEYNNGGYIIPFFNNLVDAY